MKVLGYIACGFVCLFIPCAKLIYDNRHDKKKVVTLSSIMVVLLAIVFVPLLTDRFNNGFKTGKYILEGTSETASSMLEFEKSTVKTDYESGTFTTESSYVICEFQDGRKLVFDYNRSGDLVFNRKLSTCAYEGEIYHRVVE